MCEAQCIEPRAEQRHSWSVNISGVGVSTSGMNGVDSKVCKVTSNPSLLLIFKPQASTGPIQKFECPRLHQEKPSPADGASIIETHMSPSQGCFRLSQPPSLLSCLRSTSHHTVFCPRMMFTCLTII